MYSFLIYLYLLHTQHDYRKDVICICMHRYTYIGCVYYICVYNRYSTPFLYLYPMYNELGPTLLSNDKFHLYKGQCYINLEKKIFGLALGMAKPLNSFNRFY